MLHKLQWIKHFFSRPRNILHWLIPCPLTPGCGSIICCFLSSYQKWEDKNITRLFRLGSRAQSGTLTDVSIVVMAKSCLYQTQHSGLTITANGHICHGTKKKCALSVCAVCVLCAFVLFIAFRWRVVFRGVVHSTKQKANWCLAENCFY